MRRPARLPFARAFARRLVRSRGGTAAIEFALLGPLFVLMMIAVFQFSMVMQAYSALASAAADVQRKVTVQNQAGNTLSAAQMRDLALATATSRPYFLKAAALTATVAQASPQRVTGATEYTMNLSFAAPVWVFPQTVNFTVKYKRAIFIKAAGT
ncbi:pilus assembly protein [Novosphingobium sp. KCTC 2891]|uniref:TadE/TadG family type IV pilus assembly protein n=1 Tax=Novosphingobium sp. KCTC 2891 TaxID=2989730 RepID=UPI0022235689|nr:TadE/TadG family type IV pilus assembly protein [Novosphingobium sp. KCTC 2891]MCW1383491.1 pilus assembly protein [Novosphingobium sp. KCTC 2891]